MKNLYKNIQKMREQQEAEAGPFFAELSTPETWLEIMRWLVEEKTEDFEVQMTEIAAMAIWAIQTSQESTRLGEELDRVFSDPNTEAVTDPTLSTTQAMPSMANEFGPMDHPLAFGRNRKSF